MIALPIRVRLTLWYLLVISLTFLLSSLGMYLGVRSAINRTVDSELRERTQGVQRFLARHIPNHSPEEMPDEFREHSGVRPGGDLYQVSDADGHMLYQAPTMSQLAISADLANLNTGEHFSTIERHETHLRVLSSTVQAARQNFSVQVATVISPLESVLERFGGIALATLPLILLLSGVGGYWLSGRAMKPVYEITSTADGISEHNLSQRLSVPAANDELAFLSKTLNAMLSRLETAFARVTRFTADASHELRTPVAVIRTTAEVGLAQDRTQEEYKEFLRRILAEAEYTTELVQNLLALARADAALDSFVLTDVSIVSIVEEVLPSCKLLASSRGLHWTARVQQGRDAQVRADASMVKRLLLILVDNATRYTPPGGRVLLDVTREGSSVVITVADTGLGILPEDLPKVFDRFHRGANVRGLDADGSGLGLAIAQWIAELHHGSLEIDSSPDSGTRVRFRLLVVRRTNH